MDLLPLLVMWIFVFMCSYLFYSFYLKRCLRFFSFRFVFFPLFLFLFLDENEEGRKFHQKLFHEKQHSHDHTNPLWIFWSPEQWMDFHHLSRTVVVFKIIYLFQLFEFYCLPVQCFVFWKFTVFALFLRGFWERSKTSSKNTTWHSTPITSWSHNIM